MTYANVTATLALFLALSGGLAWALANNSVKSRHIAPNAATGADVKETSLRGVDAARIDGKRILSSEFVTLDLPPSATDPASEQVLARDGSITLTASCFRTATPDARAFVRASTGEARLDMFQNDVHFADPNPPAALNAVLAIEPGQPLLTSKDFLVTTPSGNSLQGVGMAEVDIGDDVCSFRVSAFG
jgi:hypothetical protein